MHFAAVASIIAVLLVAMTTSASGHLVSAARPSAPRKMCADLCSSGLGGSSCGEMCNDLLRFRLEKLHESRSVASSSSSSSSARIVGPRRSVCPTLCSYGMGHPFCACDQVQSLAPVDWNHICSEFCVLEGVEVYGCGECDESKRPKIPMSTLSKAAEDIRKSTEEDGLEMGSMKEVDWEEECKVMCQSGDGGSACSCDIPP